MLDQGHVSEFRGAQVKVKPYFEMLFPFPIPLPLLYGCVIETTHNNLAVFQMTMKAVFKLIW